MSYRDSLYQASRDRSAKDHGMRAAEERQRDLFQAPRPAALHRTGDPDTSREAAQEVIGPAFNRRMLEALQAVQNLPGRTSNELEDILGVHAGTIRKRLNDLRLRGALVKGDKRKCAVTGRNAFTWYEAKP
jgi:DNA-directed RNA polymerase specialized sigma24 family protein